MNQGKESHFDPSTFFTTAETKARPSCQKGKTANRLVELSFPLDTYFPFFYHSRQTKARPSCQKGKTANRLTELSFPTDTYLTRFHVITVLSEEEKKSAKVIGRSRRRMWMAVYVQWIKEEDMDGSDCVVNRGGGYGWLCLYSEVRRRIWMAVYVQWIEEEDMDGCDCVVNRGGFGWLCMYSESRRRIWMAVFV